MYKTKQNSRLSVISDAETLLWRHCNVHVHVHVESAAVIGKYIIYICIGRN